MDKFKGSIILASQSPRRSQLLRAMGFEFLVQTHPVAEVFSDDLPVAKVAEYLAVLKADAATHFLQDDDTVLITADSVVIHEGQIYGKPADGDEAMLTIKQLAGSWHEVITGVCVMSRRRRVVFSEVSRVWMAAMTDAEIAHYVREYAPFDKAGAYAIQEWIGLNKIRRIEGSYTNIMGLPTHRLYEVLVNWEEGISS